MADPKAAEPIVEPVKAESPAVIAQEAQTPVVEAAPVAAEIKEEAAPKALKAAPARKSAPAPKAAAPARKRKAAPARKPAAKRKKTNTRRPVRAAATQTKQGVKIMATKKIETPFVGAEQFQAAFGQFNEKAKAAAEKSAKLVEEFADLTRGNVEAFVASSKVAAKGVESLSQDAAEYSRKSFEGATAAFKSFADVKSATDFFRLQSDFARSAFDSAVAESARLSETVLKLAGDVAEPINSRYAVAAERVKSLAA